MRTVIWIQPKPLEVGLRQPNPPTAIPGDQLGDFFQLANGTAFNPGDDWSRFADDAVRLQLARNPPSTNATEYVGKVYRVTAFGFSDAAYDVRYMPGTLTVVAV